MDRRGIPPWLELDKKALPRHRQGRPVARRHHDAASRSSSSSSSTRSKSHPEPFGLRTTRRSVTSADDPMVPAQAAGSGRRCKETSMAEALIAKNWRDLIKPRRPRVEETSPTPRQVRRRAARARLRHHPRQRAPPRAALARCRARPSPPSASRAWSTSSPPISDVAEDVTDIILNLKEVAPPHAHAGGEDHPHRDRGPARGQGGRHHRRPGRGGPEPRPPHLHRLRGRQGAHGDDLPPRPRLPAGRAQQGGGRAHRRDAHRLALHARSRRSTTRSPTPASGRPPTTTASRWRCGRTAR